MSENKTYNKFSIQNGDRTETLLDLSNDGVDEENLLLGVTAHDNTGSPIVGSYRGGGGVDGTVVTVNGVSQDTWEANTKSSATNLKNGEGTDSVKQKISLEPGYELTEDTSIVEGKTYYTRSGVEGSYVYTAVQNPIASELSTYYELFDYQNIVSGNRSVAFGNSNKITKGDSGAIGEHNEVSGGNSVALAYYNKVSSDGAVAGGEYNEVSGESAVAMGYKGKATGASSFVANNNNEANGYASASFGLDNKSEAAQTFTVGQKNETNTQRGFTAGWKNKNNGDTSALFGQENETNAMVSFTVGRRNKNKAMLSFVGGQDSESNTAGAFVHGNGLDATGENWKGVIGRFNAPKTNTLFEVGNGWENSVSGRRNAFEVCTDGRAKVNGAPTESNDAVRLTEFNALQVEVDGKAVKLVMDSLTYVLTLKDKNNNVLSTVDLPLETMVVSATYDSANKTIILYLKNGQTLGVPVGDLVSGLATTQYVDSTFVPKTATVTTGSMAGVYGYDGQGNPYKIQIGENVSGAGTIAKRTQSGTLRAATPIDDNDLATKAYADNKVERYKGADKVVYASLNNSDITVQFSHLADAYTMAYRTQDGRLKIGTPVNNDEATNKKYVDDAITGSAIEVIGYGRY